uniref:SOWAHA-C winged helix-turn-helix domain-containing protein n=1 Tax=Cyprinus carpio TaxID=7962 RepID=A0A8C1S8X6_CYPCA
MATDFTQDSVLRFIINNGGTVRNADLLTHYRRFLREDEEREQNRELFKRYVNSVATVRQEEGVSHVVLRKKYRVHLGDVAKNRESERDSKQAVSGKPQATHRGPIVRRLTSRLRSRMCRSLGEDLDQPFPEDNISARHNRLQLLSSTLSMGNLVSQSSSRGQSSRELSSPVGSTRSLSTSVHDGSFSSKHSSIPLDPREHDWFVKAASGTWTDIYALFRDDPNLLTKRDFISGFTVVHWIAKHGDHRVLNTLWYGVNKVGMTLDVNAKTLGGYTPLHLAAIHGHKKLIRLLVQKFKADVRIRDSSGKRPWQYLSKDEQRDILELLGAPQKRISGSPAMPEILSTRPATTKVNVKRNTSIAALFKHKSHLRVSSGPEAF